MYHRLLNMRDMNKLRNNTLDSAPRAQSRRSALRSPLGQVSTTERPKCMCAGTARLSTLHLTAEHTSESKGRGLWRTHDTSAAHTCHRICAPTCEALAIQLPHVPCAPAGSTL